MNQPDYQYHGMIAEYWDLLRGDTSRWSSRPYFLQIIRQSGEPALDVACGTGRLLLDYLAEGVDIDGVDISPEMIAICRRNAAREGLQPRLYVQAMEQLDLPRRYRTIIVPSSSFLQLTDPEAARRALRRFHHHLEPGGTLAMSLRVVVPEPGEEEFELIGEAARPEDGALIRHWFRCTYDLPNRLQSTEDRYEVVKDGQVIQTEHHAQSPALTWFPASEAVRLLKSEGFTDVHTHDDFTWEPATDAATSYSVVGKRP